MISLIIILNCILKPIKVLLFYTFYAYFVVSRNCTWESFDFTINSKLKL